jgi:hypothetical protein
MYYHGAQEAFSALPEKIIINTGPSLPAGWARVANCCAKFGVILEHRWMYSPYGIGYKDRWGENRWWKYMAFVYTRFVNLRTTSVYIGQLCVESQSTTGREFCMYEDECRC